MRLRLLPDPTFTPERLMLTVELPLAAAELALARAAEPAPPLDVPDLLPPFANLNTDEDWEHKAEFHPPGTYYVVANPRSFAGHGEYRSESESSNDEDEDADAPGSSQQTRPENVHVDPVTVILGSFDEEPPSAITPSSATQRMTLDVAASGSRARRLARRSASRSPPSASPSPPKKVSFAVGGAGTGAPQASSPIAMSTLPASQRAAPSYRSLPPLSTGMVPSRYVQSTATDTATPTTPSVPITPAIDFSEPALVRHYRMFVRRHLLQMPRNSAAAAVDMQDAFEKVAASFPPVRQLICFSRVFCPLDRYHVPALPSPICISRLSLHSIGCRLSLISRLLWRLLVFQLILIELYVLSVGNEIIALVSLANLIHLSFIMQYLPFQL